MEAAVPGSVSGYVLDDVNSPLNNIKIYLYRDTNNDGNEDALPIDSVYTNALGFYMMSGILPGNYVVVEVQPLYFSSISDYDTTTVTPDLDGNDSASGPDNDIPVTITPGESDTDNNFKDGRPGIICGSVVNDLGAPLSNVRVELYEDENGNGQMDPEDNMLAFLYSDGDTGNYCFEDIVPGVYIVNEVHPPDYGNLSDMDETPDPDGDDSAEGPDDNIPVILMPNENDDDNLFVDILCPGLPELNGFGIDTICSGQSVIYEAMNQGSITYSWDFGSGATPATGTGIGPHTVSYVSNPTNSTIGAHVILTLSKAGCPSVSDSVAVTVVNPNPSAAITSSTSPLCYFAPRTFVPTAAFVPGYTYTWNFGAGAIPATATGYGPHVVEYSTTGSKTVTLTVQSNAPGSNCTSVGTRNFNVVACFGNITGFVRTQSGQGIGDVLLELYPDVNRDGLSDGGPWIRQAITTSTGSYSMVGMVPGHYVIIQYQPVDYFSLSEADITNDNDSTVTNNIPNDNIIDRK